MIEETLDELKASIVKAHEALKRELSRLRTGRANASMLDGIRVDYYGTPTPISQMATVGVPEARLLTVKVWDKSSVKSVEKAIAEAGLGLNPQADGELIRLPMPSLTEERRKDLVKVARKHGEECRVAIRAGRREANEMLDQLDADGEIAADDADRAKKKVEELVAQGNQTVEHLVASKEKDILEV